MSLHLVVVEDDHLQEDPLEEQLNEAFPGARIETISTEREFRERFGDLTARPPDAVIMDVMLRWDSPSRNAPEPPPDVVAGGYHWAGVRCAELLAARSPRVPVIFWTILERSDLEREGHTLPSNTRYVRKCADPETLIRTAREVTRPAVP